MEDNAQTHIDSIDKLIIYSGYFYEKQALLALKRSWELEDKECQRLALMDAQVWAILHLASERR